MFSMVGLSSISMFSLFGLFRLCCIFGMSHAVCLILLLY